VERWHLLTVEASGKREPRVLFSRPACRAVLIDLNERDELGDHSVHEDAVLQVVSGRVLVAAGDRRAECEAGAIVVFAPGEVHSVQALAASRLLLLLAPWPGAGHFPDGDAVDPERMPAKASEPPLA
jgi:quercetin dioxygenase-like cupin family protein